MHFRNAYAPQALSYARDRDLFEAYALQTKLQLLIVPGNVMGRYQK